MDLDDAVRDYRQAKAGVDTAKQAAQRRIDAARQRADAALKALHTAMVEAAQAGMRPVEIERRTDYTKERVRQILRQGGVEPE